MYNEAGRISVSKQKTNTAPIEAILNMQPGGLGVARGRCWYVLQRLQGLRARGGQIKGQGVRNRVRDRHGATLPGFVLLIHARP